jgi:hypothetical protein
MRKAGWVVVWAWFAAGCCVSGRFPSDLKGGSRVRRDEFVDAWRVNGAKVCSKEIWAASGCYVLEVEYNATYRKQNSDVNAMNLISPIAGLIEAEANTTYATYDSGRVPFALRIRSPNSYYVTATFTGDQFIPRIIELDAAGERLGQIDPIRSARELADCRAGRPATPKAAAALPTR